MGVLAQFARLLGAKPSHDGAEALRAAYEAAAKRTRLLVLHSELAPQESSAEVLKELAERSRRQEAQLASALRELGHPLAEGPAREVDTNQNHWQRLVLDLDLQRAAIDDLREVALASSNRAPRRAALFEQLCRDCEGIRDRLRALIARADPHAHD